MKRISILAAIFAILLSANICANAQKNEKNTKVEFLFFGDQPFMAGGELIKCEQGFGTGIGFTAKSFTMNLKYTIRNLYFYKDSMNEFQKIPTSSANFNFGLCVQGKRSKLFEGSGLVTGIGFHFTENKLDHAFPISWDMGMEFCLNYPMDLEIGGQNINLGIYVSPVYSILGRSEYEKQTWFIGHIEYGLRVSF